MIVSNSARLTTSSRNFPDEEGTRTLGVIPQRLPCCPIRRELPRRRGDRIFYVHTSILRIGQPTDENFPDEEGTETAGLLPSTPYRPPSADENFPDEEGTETDRGAQRTLRASRCADENFPDEEGTDVSAPEPVVYGPPTRRELPRRRGD